MSIRLFARKNGSEPPTTPRVSGGPHFGCWAPRLMHPHVHQWCPKYGAGAEQIYYTLDERSNSKKGFILSTFAAARMCVARINGQCCQMQHARAVTTAAMLME